MPDALFIVPTVAARRKRLWTFLDAFEATRLGDTSLLIAVDDGDDPAGLPSMPGVMYGTARRMALGPKLAHWAAMFTDTYPAVGFLADDTVPETPGWDIALTQAAVGNDSPGIAYPQSGRTAIPEHQLVSSVIVRALNPGGGQKRYFPAPVAHYYGDVSWHDLGMALGILRPVGAIVRHEHYDVAAVEHDQVYRDAESAHGAADGSVYHQWQNFQLAGDVAAVRHALWEQP